MKLPTVIDGRHPAREIMRQMTRLPLPPFIRSTAGAFVKRMDHPLPLFAYFMAGCFFSAWLGYLLLQLFMPEGRGAFAGLYRMFMYHCEKPGQYIFIVSLFYAVIATPLALRCRARNRKPPGLLILLAMLLPLVPASPIGGMLWVIHDMQAGYFPEGDRFWKALQWGALEGIRSGWLVILGSIPYNLLGLAAGYFITRFGFTPEIRPRIPGGSSKSLAELGSSLPERRIGLPSMRRKRNSEL